VTEFEEWIRAKAGRKDNEVGELLHAFRGSCLTSLPEFIDDTKVCHASKNRSGSLSRIGLIISCDLNSNGVQSHQRQLNRQQE
jgi:exocyst complex protein 7